MSLLISFWGIAMNLLKSWLRGNRRGRGPVVALPPVRLEPLSLEDRTVPSGVDVRSIDGTGNNLNHVDWGSVGAMQIRMAPAEYGDGISTPAGAERPSARAISNALADQGETSTPSDRMLSAMVYAWGQFIDHDLDLTPTGDSETLKIPVPIGDPFFDPTGTGTKTIDLTRSLFDLTTGSTTARQQINAVTAWLDGSMIYGSDVETANKLRSFQGGLLKMSANGLLPLNTAENFPTGTVAQANANPTISSSQLFATGEVRSNENPELTSLHTIFAREHNRLAAQFAKENPTLTDEQLYQKARATVIAELQAITYNEWLPAVLGSNAIPRYQGYNPNVNPGISNEFSTAGFRFGHSLLGDDIEFLDNNGKEVREAVALSDAFFNPTLISQGGVDPILKYLATDPSSEIDTKVVDSVRNFLFGPPGAGGLDLASLNIERGRDHGLADYNATRQAYGLKPVTSFAQITSNVELQGKLQQLYGSVDNIDLWVGVLAEDHVSGGSMGETGRAILVEQFSRIRDGDHFWYQNTFQGPELKQVERTTLADVIQRNSGVQVLQPDVFFFRGAEVSGTVFGDANQSKTQDVSEAGLANVWVFADFNKNGKQDKNEPGLATDASGHYSFLVPVAGPVQIVALAAPGQKATTADPQLVKVAAGQDVSATNFGFVDVSKPPQSKQPDAPRSPMVQPPQSKVNPPPMQAPAPQPAPAPHGKSTPPQAQPPLQAQPSKPVVNARPPVKVNLPPMVQSQPALSGPSVQPGNPPAPIGPVPGGAPAAAQGGNAMSPGAPPRPTGSDARGVSVGSPASASWGATPLAPPNPFGPTPGKR
jgi:hypothetical protein